MSVVIVDGKARCSWCTATEEYIAYHDNEWGFPVADDRVLFEKLCLESFQSGLSWRTILQKRENFRQAFHHFDIDQVAAFGEQDVQRLLQDKSIVRHRGKIEAVINNARCAQVLIKKEGSLAAFIWAYEPVESDFVEPIPATTKESAALAKALKALGWKFVGPTTVYAFMQSMGLVNDHANGCATREAVEKARTVFVRPGQ